MEDYNRCVKCDELTDTESIKCDGGCGKSMHGKCILISSKPVLKVCRESPNIAVYCDECSRHSLRAVNEKLNKLFSLINIYDERAIRNEKGLSDIIKSVEEMRLSVHESGSELIKEIGKVSLAEGKDSTYAEKVKMDNNNAVVVVKPKCVKQQCKKTESDLKQKINPCDLNIDKMRYLPNGGIAIECKDIASQKAVEAAASEQLGEDYSVQLPVLLNPRVKLVGIRDDLSEIDIVECLKKQNECLQDSKMKLIRKFTRNNGTTVVLEVDAKSMEACMKEGRLKINWERCRVFEDLNVYMCHKCCGFNHMGGTCKNKLACVKCAGEHIGSRCENDVEMCVNCMVANSKYGLKLKTNHKASSRECEVFKRKEYIRRKRINYSE